MNLTLWTNPKSESDVRLYVNGSTLLSKEQRVFFAQDGEGTKLITPSGVDRAALISELVDNAIISKDTILKKTPFSEMELKALKKSNPSANGIRIVGVGDRVSEADRLDVRTIKVPDPVKIVIDHREPDELVKLLTGLPNVEVIRDTLECGDIEINDCILVERKCCTGDRTDFEASIIDEDKRLFNQSEKMRLRADVMSFIMIEGPVHTNSRSMLIQQIDGAISFLSVLQGVSVVNTLSLNHSAYFLLKLAAHNKSGLGYTLSLRGKKPSLISDQLAFTLEGMPGISGTLSRELAAKFGSLAGLAKASKEDLLSIKGLGKKKLEWIWCLIHG